MIRLGQIINGRRRTIRAIATFMEYLAEYDITFTDSIEDPEAVIKVEEDEPASSSSSRAGADLPSSSTGKARITKRADLVAELNQPDSFIHQMPPEVLEQFRKTIESVPDK
eukprot:3446794-Karenia_brevis.AAC.1